MTSLRNCDQDFAGDCFFCSTRWIAFEEAVWIAPCCGPITCGFSRSAEVAKICPTGALLKNGFLKPGDRLALQQCGLAGQVARLLEDGRLGRRRGQELDQVGGRRRVLRLRRHGQVGAAPVPAGSRRQGDVPLALRRRRLPLDVAHHPGRAGDGREAALLVARVPVVAEGRETGRLAGRDPRHRQVPGGLDLRVRRNDHLAVLVVVGRVDLADHRVVDVAAGVEERDALRRLLLEALAGLDERPPGRPEVRDSRPVRRQARLLEQVAAVADRQAADVRAEPDDLTLAAERLLPLPRQPPVLERSRAVLAQVHEPLRLGLELRDEADLDRLDVGGAGVRGDALREVRVVDRVVLNRLLDRDAGMRRLVLLVEVVVAEVAEEADRQRHRLGLALACSVRRGISHARDRRYGERHGEDPPALPSLCHLATHHPSSSLVVPRAEKAVSWTCTDSFSSRWRPPPLVRRTTLGPRARPGARRHAVPSPCRRSAGRAIARQQRRAPACPGGSWSARG